MPQWSPRCENPSAGDARRDLACFRLNRRRRRRARATRRRRREAGPRTRWSRPSPATELTIKAVAPIAKRSSGLPKTRVIGCPRNQDITARSGETTRAIWMADPRQMSMTRPILSRWANRTAAKRSADVPARARTTTPRNNGDRWRLVAVASRAPETSSASNATATVPATRIASGPPMPRADDGSGLSLREKMFRCVTSV